MATTARGGFTYDESVAYAPVFYVRENWDDDWELLPEARLIEGHVSTAAHDDSELRFLTEYGAVSHLWEKTYLTRASLDLRGWWVRMDLVGPDGIVPQFVGFLGR